MAANSHMLDRSAFISELATLCHSLRAPFSRQIMGQTLTAFDAQVGDSDILLCCISKPADVVNFRIAWPGRLIDTVAIAAQADWISTNHPLAALVHVWYLQGNVEQWCDSGLRRGIIKTWV